MAPCQQALPLGRARRQAQAALQSQRSGTRRQKLRQALRDHGPSSNSYSDDARQRSVVLVWHGQVCDCPASSSTAGMRAWRRSVVQVWPW
jgi:hypothetical protein